MRLMVVIASTRRGRQGKKVADWFVSQAEVDERFEIDLVDLKELNLSYELPEKLASAVKNSDYDDPDTRAWAERVKKADAVVFVSPEYNHGLPASLKNALDHLDAEWHGKPTGFVGYGAGGAPYSQAALMLVASWIKLDIVTPRVSISEVWSAFAEDGHLKFSEMHQHEANRVLDALARKVEAVN